MAVCHLQVCQKTLIVFIVMIFTLQTHNLSLPVDITSDTPETPETAGSDNIHDVIEKYGLPRGLIPNIVQSYTLSEDGHFEVILENPCYVQFDELVYYKKVLKGKLKYGSATQVSGIQAKKLFAWVNINGIDADIESDMVVFHVGLLSRKLSAKQFQEIPFCMNKA